MKKTLVCYVSVLLAPLAAAQEGTFLGRLMAEDAAAVNAVVMYPADVRETIFEASTNPGALVRIANLQEKTRAEFLVLLNTLEEEDRKKFWELSRYPELVTFMAGDRKRSAAELDEKLQNYPQVIHDFVREYNGKKRRHIVSLNELNNAADASFGNLLASYP